MQVTTHKDPANRKRTISIEISDIELHDDTPSLVFLLEVREAYERYENALENQRMMEEAGT